MIANKRTGTTKDAPQFAILLLLLSLSCLLRPATCFQQQAHRIHNHKLISSHQQPRQHQQRDSHPSMITRLTAASSSEDHSSNSHSGGDTQLLQAKLHVLEDVVVKLNGTKYQDQEEMMVLESKVDDLQESLQAKQIQYEHDLQIEQDKLQQELKTAAEKERTALETKHAQDIQKLEQSLVEKSRLDQDERAELLSQERIDWNTSNERQWQEKLEIATAAVTAGESREHDLQTKLELVEVRYQQEAADYKAELMQLQKEWKDENGRLEVDVKRLQSELSDTKQKRDSETTLLIEKLGDRSKQLEHELATSKEQAQLQRLKFKTQQQMAQAEWEEQREKERKFTTEAMRLLQQENTAMREHQGFWRRLFRFGKRSFKKPRPRSSRSFL